MIDSYTNLRERLDEEINEIVTMASDRRRFLQTVPLFWLAACASKPKMTRFREGDNTGQNVSISVEDERQMTEDVLPQMRKDYPPVEDAQMQAYLASLGRKIASSNQLEDNPYKYTFTLVDTPTVNAFALPAGTIYVTAPLLAMADSEAELAGVLGHEIGHIQARHAAERMHMAKQSNSMWYAVGGGILGGALGYGAGKMLCKPKDKKCLQNSALVGAGAGAGGALLIEKYRFMANSREDEMEADRIGFRTSVRAGYDRNHVGLFYEKLLKMEEQNRGGQKSGVLSSLSDAMSTHPPSRERVQQMREMASQASGDGRISSEGFKNIRQKAMAISKKYAKG